MNGDTGHRGSAAQGREHESAAGWTADGPRPPLPAPHEPVDGPGAPGPGQEVLADWADGFGRRAGNDVLPPHHPDCLGCGPDNPHGHHIQVRRDGDRVVAEHVFDHRHGGAPGIAHGGAVATVVDDLFGFLLYIVGEPAVTRHLEVDYQAPVWLGRGYRIRASVDRRDGRKLFMSAAATDDSGAEAFTARAVFVVVPLEHFAGRGQPGVPPIAP